MITTGRNVLTSFRPIVTARKHGFVQHSLLVPEYTNRFLRLNNARQTAELGNIDNTSFYPTHVQNNGISIIAHYLTARFLPLLSACLAPMSQDRIHEVREQHRRHA